MSRDAEIKALREEVAELRKQIAAMTEAMLQLAVAQPVQVVPYVIPAPQPLPLPYPWWSPTVTYSTDTHSLTS